MTGATCFDDSVVRFTDSPDRYGAVPSDKSLGYSHTVRFADFSFLHVSGLVIRRVRDSI